MFGGDFLEAFELDPNRCRVIMLFNDAMWPDLPRGCNLLVDKARRSPQPGVIYAIEHDDELLIRRAEPGPEGWRFVANKESLPPVVASDVEIIGQVVWAARLVGLGIDAADALKGMSG